MNLKILRHRTESPISQTPLWAPFPGPCPTSHPFLAVARQKRHVCPRSRPRRLSHMGAFLRMELCVWGGGGVTGQQEPQESLWYFPANQGASSTGRRASQGLPGSINSPSGLDERWVPSALLAGPRPHRHPTHSLSELRPGSTQSPLQIA